MINLTPNVRRFLGLDEFDTQQSAPPDEVQAPVTPVDSSAWDAASQPTAGAGTSWAPQQYPDNIPNSIPGYPDSGISRARDIPYDPRDADSGPRESGPAPWTPTSPEGTPAAATTTQPAPPQYTYEIADGRTAPPTPNGDWRPMEVRPRPAPVADQGLPNPYGAPRSPAADLNPGAPADYGDGGQARRAAQQPEISASRPVQSTYGEPDYVDRRSDAERLLTTPVAMPARRELAPYDPERAARDPGYNASRSRTQDDVAAIPYQALEAIRQSVLDVVNNVEDTGTAWDEQRKVAALGNALLGVANTLGLPYNVVARTVNQMFPEMTIAGVGVGDVLSLYHDAFRLGAGAAGVVQSAWQGKPVAAFERGVEMLGRGQEIADNAIEAARPVVGAAVQGVKRAGRAVGEEIAGQLLDLPTVPRMAQAGEGGMAALADAPAHRYSPTAPEGMVRRYHGGADAFDAVSPDRLNENSLYGPGYYTTSDPRVASSYAANRQTNVSMLESMLAEEKARLSKPWNQTPEAQADLKRSIEGLQREIDAATQSGPNVRAVDVPADLNLIDADAPLQPETVARVRDVVNQVRQTNPRVADELDEALVTLERSMQRKEAIGAPPLTNDQLLTDLMDAADRASIYFDGKYGGKGISTAILERAGFDGIAHQGGKRVPMLDSAGQPIEHDVTVVFPGRVDKVTNAFSGTKGGAFLPFDPFSAGMGAGAGAELDEDGNPVGVDPLRAGAGMAVAGVLGTPRGRRLITNAARNAKQSAPPNLLELLQNFRFSWGMLGNFSTGAVNAMGAPVEIALGLPSEAFRMGVLHGRPAAVGYQAVEMMGGIKQGVRDMLGTVIGQVPDAVRNAPDFRPPINERMQGTTGKALGHAIEFPGRLTSQAPDALWRPILERWGRAREAGNIMAENGTSMLNPAEQWREMGRIMNNPTAAEAQRLDAGAKAWADEMGYKGDAGYWEQAVGSLVRPNNRTTTSNDPLAAQVHEALGSFVMPFLGAVFKLHKLAASRVPVTGFVTNRSLPLDEKISRQLVGAALGLYLADRAAQGLITGPGPSDPDEAAVVNKDMPPNHFYVPAIGWVPNDYAGSVGAYLNAIGGYYDARRYATEKEKADAEQMGWRTAKDVMRAFERFPVAQAAQDVIAFVESPKKGLTDFLSRAGSSFMPAPMKTYMASQDPNTRTVDQEAPFVDLVGQKMVRQSGYVPGIGRRQDLPAAQDRLGRDVENPRQGWAAFGLNVKQPQNDPIIRLFREADVQPGMPRKDLSIPTPAGVPALPPIDLTTKEQRDWNRFRGEAIIKMAQPKADDPVFSTLPFERRQAQLQFILTEANKTANLKMQAQIGPEEIKRRVQAKQAMKKAG